MENFGNLLPEVEAAANELRKNMAENIKASIDMCVAATADVAIGELAEQMAYEAPAASNDLTTEFEAEVAACACDTCLEEAAPDQTLDEADVALYYAEADDDLHDGLQMALEAVAELKARFEALEERITLFNVRSSHKL